MASWGAWLGGLGGTTFKIRRSSELKHQEAKSVSRAVWKVRGRHICAVCCGKQWEWELPASFFRAQAGLLASGVFMSHWLLSAVSVDELWSQALGAGHGEDSRQLAWFEIPLWYLYYSSIHQLGGVFVGGWPLKSPTSLMSFIHLFQIIDFKTHQNVQFKGFQIG